MLFFGTNSMDHIAYFKKNDKKLAGIIDKPIDELPVLKNIPLTLIRSIINQQLSTRVSEVIYKRFLGLYDGKEPALQQILHTPLTKLRSVGFSNAKAGYVHNIAAFCIEQNVTDKMLKSMTDEEVMDLLTQIKGVGHWTVEMLLMFSLGREDVIAIDDLLKEAMIKLYRIKTTDKRQLREKMMKISDKWRPYRTYACMYLWKWKNG